MRMLIAGKNGQIGSSLVALLSNYQQDITLLALGKNELDITNSEYVNQVVNDFRPDIIVNAAAYTAVDKAETDEAQAKAINCNGPHNLAIAANNINACLIHISTDYVFEGNKFGTYNESDTVNPQSIYGQTKLDGEQAVVSACPAHIILRTAWVFSELGSNFVKTMLSLAKTHDSLQVVNDQFGGPTYAGDIANAVIKISLDIMRGNTNYGIYHYSGYPHIAWDKFASEIFSLAKEKELISNPIVVNGIITEEYPTAAKRPANSKLNCTKIKNNFDIEPSDWRAALENITKYQ